MNRARALSALELFFLPFLKALAGPQRRAWLRRCIELTKAKRDQQKAQRLEAAILEREAKIYGELLVRAWARLGSMYIARWTDGAGNKQGRRARRYKRDYVKFQVVITQPERIWFKILVAKRTLFGSYLDMLPHLVTAGELVKPETLNELTIACQRKVTHFQNSQVGLWVIVNRLDNADGLPTLVKYRDMLPHFPANAGQIGAVVIGVGENRTVELADLMRHRFWLVGGAQGGGKSNMVNVIISSLMRFTHPKDVKLVLIDLKQVEFAGYEDTPHLYREVVFEPDEALATLEEMVALIRERTRMMRKKARNIIEWNERFPDQHMDRIVVIVDEFAELTLGAETAQLADKISKLAGRLSSLGRAVGIHLMVCTQRPAVEVVSNRVKVNMDLTICARTQNSTQSTTILGTGDAALLPLIPGRMLALSGSELKALQTPLITEDDIQESIAIARGRQAGVIDLDGYSPVIVDNGLIDDLDRAGGELAPQTIYLRYAPLGITRKMLRPWLANLVRKTEVTTQRGKYKIFKRDGKYWIRLEEQYIADTPPEPEAPQVIAPREIVIESGAPSQEKPAPTAALVPRKRLWEKADDIVAMKLLRERQKREREAS